MTNLELQRAALLRELVPLVNWLAARLDRGVHREDLVLNWFVDATRKS
jgi:hypothetical protein